MQLIIFTNNQHKIHEIKTILQLSIPIVSYREVFDQTVDVIEDGDTFEANAIIKVQALPNRPDIIYLAEDSGIEVAHLDERQVFTQHAMLVKMPHVTICAINCYKLVTVPVIVTLNTKPLWPFDCPINPSIPCLGLLPAHLPMK